MEIFKHKNMAEDPEIETKMNELQADLITEMYKHVTISQGLTAILVELKLKVNIMPDNYERLN